MVASGHHEHLRWWAGSAWLHIHMQFRCQLSDRLLAAVDHLLWENCPLARRRGGDVGKVVNSCEGPSSAMLGVDGTGAFAQRMVPTLPLIVRRVLL